ncbi:MAG: signal peptidase II [Vicinamibacterales bacterium]
MTALTRRIELWLGCGIVVLDQLTKWLVRRTIELHDSVEIVPNFLNLTHVRNSGAAFGFLNGVDFPFKSVVIVVVAVVALAAIALYARQLGAETLTARVAFGLVLGGAVGNLIDRATAGYVVDFVDAYWGAVHFWAFNVADSAITVGAILMLIDLVRTRAHVSSTV